MSDNIFAWNRGYFQNFGEPVVIRFWEHRPRLNPCPLHKTLTGIEMIGKYFIKYIKPRDDDTAWYAFPSIRTRRGRPALVVEELPRTS